MMRVREVSPIACWYCKAIFMAASLASVPPDVQCTRVRCAGSQPCSASSSACREGVIQGGWEFVIAAYTFSGVALALYTVSIVLRFRAAQQDQDQEQR